MKVKDWTRKANVTRVIAKKDLKISRSKRTNIVTRLTATLNFTTRQELRKVAFQSTTKREFSLELSTTNLPHFDDFSSDDCCPIQWRCPDETTTVVPDSSAKTLPSDQKCSFGKLKMNVGDFLSPEDDYDQCTICSCSLPPYPHCIKTC